jgi:para-aminobenzoate synthetase / 4-amino-4-deoxychorismate lyase
VAEVFALLDDRDASTDRPTSRLYRGFVREHRCTDPATLDAVWQQADADLRGGLHAVMLADYEWGAKLLRAGDAKLAPDDASALRLLMFGECLQLSRDEVDAWLAMQPGADEPAGTMALEASVDRVAFSDAIAQIHKAIRDGETYQVNYTYRLDGQAYGEPAALYRQLRALQPVAYGAFIALPETLGQPTHLISCSPELFLQHAAGLLTARPMKGTAPRIGAPESDSETARLLGADTKNRAENLMIVDLLRNDLGRVARIGSVKVPSLFAIEPYATVFQMTSTIEAQLRPEVGFTELLRAVFPCGSITGAPKHHTMGLISQLETTPRGLYCGAIGWLAAPTDPTDLIGDFCLSVAIRTFTLHAAQNGLRALRLGVGAGIVSDSRADDEFEECRIKARFLTRLAPGFELFETMLAEPGRGVALWPRHLARLTHSAHVLGFAFDAEAAQQAVEECALGLREASRVRLALRHDGRLAITQAALRPLAEGVVDLLIAGQRLPEVAPLAAHKTTLRAHYDAGVRAAEAVGAFDSLFFDTAGRLVEGGRSSVFVRLGGRWFTPPLADGALPGVMRGVLLDDPAWAASERRLMRADLDRAEAVVVCNALRGVLQARIEEHHATPT